jgi:predicted dehydrogenase
MGSVDQQDFQRNRDVEIVAVCDVNQENAARARERSGGAARVYVDYRRLLEDRAVEAVIIATPDHWHAKIFVDACSAGKDIYLEKPIANSIREGRLMVDAARRANRIVQVGLQQRSGSHFQRAVKLIRTGSSATSTLWSASIAARRGPSFGRSLRGPRDWTGISGWGPPPNLRTAWLGTATGAHSTITAGAS